MKISVIIAGYMGIAPLLSMSIARLAAGGYCSRLLAAPIVLFSTPAILFWLFMLWLASIPFHSLYPERHLTVIDIEGSDEEKKALAELRAALKKKSLFRRLAERLGLVRITEPNWPAARTGKIIRQGNRFHGVTVLELPRKGET